MRSVFKVRLEFSKVRGYPPLGVEEGTFALLQTYHDIEKVKGNTFENQIPNLSSLRKALFWDTDIEKID